MDNNIHTDSLYFRDRITDEDSNCGEMKDLVCVKLVSSKLVQ